MMKKDYVLVHVVDNGVLWFWSGVRWTNVLDMAKTYAAYTEAAIVIWLAPDQMLPGIGGYFTVTSKEELKNLRYLDLARAMTLLSVRLVPATAMMSSV